VAACRQVRQADWIGRHRPHRGWPGRQRRRPTGSA